MFNRVNKQNGESNETMIFKYIKEALRLEIKSDAGKYNIAFSLLGLSIGGIAVFGEAVTDVVNAIFSIFRLGKIYESKTNCLPLGLAFGFGVLCLLLMVFIVDKQQKVKSEIESIRDKKIY